MSATRFGIERAELATLLDGHPRYRLDQVWAAMYAQGGEPSSWTTLPKGLRDELAHALPRELSEKASSVSDDGDTIKFLFETSGGHRIETVLMKYSDRATVCVSTQAGCAMGCSFCATGQAGFSRHLTVGEIVEQVALAKEAAASTGRRLTNVVAMGMGEPLANEDALWPAMQRIHDDFGLSARHLTVSTVGLIPGIRRLAERPLPVTLAVSLHAARDELRNQLIPINRRYPIRDLMNACRDYVESRRRRMSFEWAMIDGVNDSVRDAEELARLCREIRPVVHVNLIPLNRTPGYPVSGSSHARIQAFRAVLDSAGVPVTVRRNRGNEIDAACGQLAAGQPIKISRKT